MKNINQIISTNWWLIALTIPLYFVMIGILFHLVLGIFQVSVFLYILFEKIKFTPNLNTLLTIYVILTIITISVMLFYQNAFFYAWISASILPFYFTGILYQLKKQYDEN
ncbi:MAG: hypothetical protein ACSHW7_10790 [Patiriisocius sp.]|uniref:hypothetical protein n=1 Tax=Patiriisocius sp. TaxID=2822396 RepID=UPI003EF720D6